MRKSNLTGWTIRMICVSLILPSLYAFAVAPLYVVLASDVAYQSTIWTTLVMQCTYLLDILRYWLTVSILIACHYLYSRKECIRLYVIAVLGDFYEHLANLGVDYLRNGIDTSDILYDILMVLFYTALESVILIVLFLVWKTVMFRQKRREKALAKAGRYIPDYCGEDISVFPFRKFLDFTNPLQCAAFWSCSFVSLLLIGNALVYDIYLGAPEDISGWLQVTWMYVSLLLTVIAGYVFVRLLLSLFLRKQVQPGSIPPENPDGSQP